MLYKAFARTFAFMLVLLAVVAVPHPVAAGGLCGGTYIVEQGETLESIAATCGTSVSAITAANPGISGSLSAGQSLTVPGLTGTNPTPPPVVPTNPPSGNYGNIPVSYNGIYIVRYGDTFSKIASRFGVSLNDLWAANPYISNINIIYVGQILHVPGSIWYSPMPILEESAEHLSYGTVPAGTPKGKIRLSNQANAEVYVSLQGTTRDGIDVINEYTVQGNMTVKVPAGWYTYVAWVGGREFVGQFNLGGDADHTITFYSNKVVVK